MTEELARREKRSPDELIAEGKIQATALMKVVKEAGLSKDLGGNKPHLEVEAWQTIGRFNGYLTDIVWTRPIVEGGVKAGYEARAELVRIDDGVHVIGAEASCFFDEEIERRDGTSYKRWDEDYAVRSMAQTRAQSKLGRMAFAWVAVLAGYSGTPAEEMEGVRRDGASKPAVFPFGKHKDKVPSDLELKDLHSEQAFWEKKIAEETNPRFKTNNERLLNAIKAAIAEKTAKPEMANPYDPNQDPQPPASDDQPSPLEQARVRLTEFREAHPEITDAKITLWCRKNKGCGVTELDALSIGALIAHLSGETQPTLV
jgi:hypothetical protein